MNKQPLFLMLLCFLLGIFLREWWCWGKLTNLGLALVFGIILGLSFFWKRLFSSIQPYIFGSFFFSIGAFLHGENSEKPKLPEFSKEEIVVFQIEKKLNSNEKNRKYEITILDVTTLSDKSLLPVKAVLSIPREKKDLDFQHYYKGKLFIHEPIGATHDYQFDYRKYLARQGIYFQAYLKGEFQSAVKPSLSFGERVKQTRLALLQKINQTPLSSKVQEFLKGIILADRTEMDEETVKDFNRSGLVHLLAISGTHMVIIFWVVFAVLNKVIPARLRKVAIVLSLMFIWTFAIFIDYGPSVVRSCLMLTFYYIMVLLQRKSDLLHSLALSAFLILGFDTQQLFDVGFQLSYLAVLGIWWLARPIEKRFRRPKFLVEEIFYKTLAMTLAAQIATMPLVVYYFHQFSLISIVANLVIIPMAEIIIVFSLLMVVLIWINWAPFFIMNIFDAFINTILKIIHWFSGFDEFILRNLDLNLIELPILLVSIYYLRFWIKDFSNLGYQLRLSFSLMIFWGVRLGFDIHQYHQKEVLVHPFYQQNIISIKEKDKVYFWMNDDKNLRKINDYIIQPYITSRRVKAFEILELPSDANVMVYDNQRIEIGKP